MATTTELREQRANLWEQMKALTDLAEREDRDFNAEEKGTYSKLEADLDSLGDRIDRQERMAALDRKLDRIVDMPPGLIDGQRGTRDEAGDEQAYAEAFGEFVRFGMADMSAESRQLMAARRQEIKNAAGVGTGSAGGFTVPPAFRAIMVETMKAYGAMLDEAEEIETETGTSLPWPTNDDTANIGAIVGENVAVTEQDVTFGSASLGAFMFTSKLVRASLQFLNDSTVSEQWLARKLGERIGRALSQKFTIGAGTTEPAGLVSTVGATPAVTGSGSFGSTGGVSYDNLVDLQESLDPAYGGHPNAKWMMHQTVRKAVRKLKDSTGKPIWEPSTQVGVPDSLLGRPIRINNDMATLAQNSLSLGYGNIRGAYVTRHVAGSAILLRLAERYAEFAQVGFLAFDRWDGTVQDANAFKVFKTTATA